MYNVVRLNELIQLPGSLTVAISLSITFFSIETDGKEIQQLNRSGNFFTLPLFKLA